MDALTLARVQFAANISFHILFPTLTIALAWALVYFKLRWLKSRQQHWLDAYQFWTKVFALTFALGVVSGITMSFQFGTNWPGFMLTVGNIAGPLLAYEVLTAFFLEASFLGIMLFGRKRVGERMHTLATVLVAIGTSLSAFWILALNSWMHTPQGHVMIEGQAHAADWWAIIFNPSFPYRLTHMLLASGLTCSFVMAGLSAYRWRRGDRGADVRVALRAGVVTAALLIPVQVFVGDLHGLNTLQHQPQKIAAMEALWHDERGAPLVLLAWPDEATQRNVGSIEVPKLASLILTHEWEGELKGLSSFPNHHPPVAPVFYAFRVMVGIGLLMWLVSWWAAWQTRRQRAPGPWLTRTLIAMTYAGWVATLAGWYVTEIGRQPWLVTGILKTADAATDPAIVPASTIGLSLAGYLTLYAVLLLSYLSVLAYMARKARGQDLGVNLEPQDPATRSA